MFLPTILMIAIGAGATLFYGLALFIPLTNMLRELTLPDLLGWAPPIDVSQGVVDIAHAKRAEVGMSDSVGLNGAGGRLTGGEAAELSRQIAGLASAGLPLAMAWSHSAKSCREAGSAPIDERARRDPRVGHDARPGCSRARGSAFPRTCAGLVIAGLRTGRLGDILSRFSQYVGDRHRAQAQAVAQPGLSDPHGRAWPLALFFFVCVIMVGQFETIYRGLRHPAAAVDHRAGDRSPWSVNRSGLPLVTIVVGT